MYTQLVSYNLIYPNWFELDWLGVCVCIYIYRLGWNFYPFNYATYFLPSSHLDNLQICISYWNLWTCELENEISIFRFIWAARFCSAAVVGFFFLFKRQLQPLFIREFVGAFCFHNLLAALLLFFWSFCVISSEMLFGFNFESFFSFSLAFCSWVCFYSLSCGVCIFGGLVTWLFVYSLKSIILVRFVDSI